MREISLFIYSNGTHYKRLIQYFANMLLLSYIIIPSTTLNAQEIDKDKLYKTYIKTLDYIEKMNIQHEFSKVLLNAFRDDVYYGYIYETTDSFVFQKINPNYCKISSVEDGCFNFSFDFQYFNTYKDQLQLYPLEFQQKYQTYKSNGIKNRWIELDPKNTLCLKVNEDLDFVLPPFAGVFENILEIDDYKSLKLAKEEIGNYKLIIQRIPLRKEGEDNDDFLISFDQAMLFHERISQNLPEQVGIATTPMEVTDISFDRDKVDKDNVSEAMSNFYSNAGVSDMLFNPGEKGSIGLNKSVQVDESDMFKVLRQIERWINRRMKQKGGIINKFRIMMPNLTIFNQSDEFEKYLKAAQFGVPTKSLIGASLNISPSAILNLGILENEILELNEKFIPLQSSHTLGGDEAGRPEKKEKDLDVAGIKTKDKKTNDNRNK